MRKTIQKDFAEAVQEMKRYFDAAVEHFKRDLRTIDIEKMDDHEQRMIKLELFTGLRP